jgi:hypothetical protein
MHAARSADYGTCDHVRGAESIHFYKHAIRIEVMFFWKQQLKKKGSGPCMKYYVATTCRYLQAMLIAKVTL